MQSLGSWYYNENIITDDNPFTPMLAPVPDNESASGPVHDESEGLMLRVTGSNHQDHL